MFIAQLSIENMNISLNVVEQYVVLFEYFRNDVEIEMEREEEKNIPLNFTTVTEFS